MSLLVDQWFLKLLDELNQEVAACGELVEGNLFYQHLDPDFPRIPITPVFETKRQNLLAACRNRHSMLEIGVNAGHSALWVLHNNPQLTYHGVDIYEHEYTAAAAAFLKDTFGERVHFHAGDSVHVLPRLREHNKVLRFDVIHVDGSHEEDCYKTDVYNALSVATPDCWLVIDDSHADFIREFYEKLLQDDRLLDKKPDGWKDNIYHVVAVPHPTNNA